MKKTAKETKKMAMRKRKIFRTRRRTFRRRRPHFARQKFDRVQIYNNLNQELTNLGGAQNTCESNVFTNCRESEGDCAPTDGVAHCCASTATFTLLRNSTSPGPQIIENINNLRGYGGTVTLVRIYGDIWFRSHLAFPTGGDLCLPQSPPTLEQYARRYGETWHWGLRKYNETMAEQNSDSDTAADVANAWYGYDWTEAKWLWQRRKFWAPIITQQNFFLQDSTVIGVCANVTGTGGGGGSLVNSLASGTGNINTDVSDIDVHTTCNPVFYSPEGCDKHYQVLQAREPPWHHVRVSIKKHITLRADERLDLQCGVRHPAMPGNVTGWGCADITGGFTGENANYRVFMRLAGVVRLN